MPYTYKLQQFLSSILLANKYFCCQTYLGLRPSGTVHIYLHTNWKYLEEFVQVHRQCTLLISLSIVGSQMAMKLLRKGQKIVNSKAYF